MDMKPFIYRKQYVLYVTEELKYEEIKNQQDQARERTQMAHTEKVSTIYNYNIFY